MESETPVPSVLVHRIPYFAEKERYCRVTLLLSIRTQDLEFGKTLSRFLEHFRCRVQQKQSLIGGNGIVVCFNVKILNLYW